MFDRSGPDPLRLRFEEVSRQRPRSLLSPFVDVDRTDLPELRAGEPVDLGPSPRAPFCAVVAEVTGIDDDAALEIGLVGGQTAVVGRYDAGHRSVAVDVRSRRGRVEVRAPAELAPPFGLAIVLNANRVTVLTRPAGEDWRPLVTEGDRVPELVDLCDPAEFGRLRYVCGAARSAAGDISDGMSGGISGGAVRLARVRAGYSGRTGVRDPQAVRHADGRPLVRDGKLWLTMTDAGLGFFSCAHWGVWTVDLADPARIEQVGAIFSARDGRVLGDHAGQVVVDEAAGRAVVLVSSWGDFSIERGVHVRAATTTPDVLRGISVLATERVRLPTPHSAWDPSLARIGGRWHMAFTECVSFGPPRFVFHPALAVAAVDGSQETFLADPHADPLAGLVRVGADESREQTEGTLLQRFGDDWYLLASDRDVPEYPIYDTRMRCVGALGAPYGSNIPHPMLVPAGEAPDAPWWLLTFDGTPWHEDVLGYGTHGDFVVMAGTPVGTGRRLAGVARRGLGGLLRS